MSRKEYEALVLARQLGAAYAIIYCAKFPPDRNDAFARCPHERCDWGNFWVGWCQAAGETG